MAELIVPKYVYRERGQSLCHLSLAGGEGPIMVCGKFIYQNKRIVEKMKDVPAGSLCPICLGAMQVK